MDALDSEPETHATCSINALLADARLDCNNGRVDAQDAALRMQRRDALAGRRAVGNRSRFVGILAESARSSVQRWPASLRIRSCRTRASQRSATHARLAIARIAFRNATRLVKTDTL
jgi:hypothetical protein